MFVNNYFKQQKLIIGEKQEDKQTIQTKCHERHLLDTQSFISMLRLSFLSACWVRSDVRGDIWRMTVAASTERHNTVLGLGQGCTSWRRCDLAVSLCARCGASTQRAADAAAISPHPVQQWLRHRSGVVLRPAGRPAHRRQVATVISASAAAVAAKAQRSTVFGGVVKTRTEADNHAASGRASCRCRMTALGFLSVRSQMFFKQCWNYVDSHFQWGRLNREWSHF